MLRIHRQHKLGGNNHKGIWWVSQIIGLLQKAEGLRKQNGKLDILLFPVVLIPSKLDI